jgi:putative SOS response-associated peptidase YedK
MCGRFGVVHTGAELAGLFELVEVPDVPPQLELCPTDPVPAVTEQADGRHLELYRWWLVPSWWKKELRELPTLFNAKGETLAEKPMFRSAFQSRRCLVPASYFYEWSKGAGGKQKLRISRRDAQPLALAGLWEEWRQPDGTPLRSCTIVTTSPNAVMAQVHTRMPVILGPEGWAEWLSPDSKPDELQHLLRPCPDEWLEIGPAAPPAPPPDPGYTGRFSFD